MKKFVRTNILPSAPTKTHKRKGVTYVGAVPRYSVMQKDPYSPVTWIKTHKGVPFRREET